MRAIQGVLREFELELFVDHACRAEHATRRFARATFVRRHAFA